MNFMLSQPFPNSLLPSHSQLIPLLISTRSRRVSSPFVFIAALTNGSVRRNSAEPCEITWNGRAQRRNRGSSFCLAEEKSDGRGEHGLGNAKGS